MIIGDSQDRTLREVDRESGKWMTFHTTRSMSLTSRPLIDLLGHPCKSMVRHFYEPNGLIDSVCPESSFNPSRIKQDNPVRTTLLIWLDLIITQTCVR